MSTHLVVRDLAVSFNGFMAVNGLDLTIHKGELRGIGAINDIRTSVAGRSEVIWDGAHALSAVSGLLIESHVTGETVRGIVRSEDIDSLLDQLRRQRARLISVTPLHGTLEEYFLARTSEQEKVIS